MKRRTISSGVMLASCLLMATGFFLRYIEIDLGKSAGILNEYLGEIFGRIPELEDGRVSFSACTLIRGVVLLRDGGTLGNPQVGVFLVHIFTVLLLPYVLGIVNGVLAFLRKRGSYLVSAVLSVLTAIFILADTLIFLPGSLTGLLPAFYSVLFGSEGAGLFRELILGGLREGYWINLLSLLLSFGAALAGCIGKCPEKRESVKKERRKAGASPGILCLNGSLEGGRIPVKDGEEILVGRDARISHLILEGERVSRRHCRIRYDGEQDAYFVTDYSMNGTFLPDGNRLPTNQEIRLSRGSRISIGSVENQILLE